MFVHQMTPAFLPVRADFVAVFDEAGVRLLSSITLCSEQTIVVLGDVQVEEARRGEVGGAFRAAIGVGLSVVAFIVGVGWEGERLVGRKGAAHSGGRRDGHG